MTIAFIGQKGIPAKNGGVDRHVENLARFLAIKGENVIVYNRKNYLANDIKEWNGVKLISLPFINQQNLAAITHGFLATVDAIKRKVDVIHYQGIGPCLLAWIPRVFAPKIRVVATLHSFDYGNDKWGSFAKLMLKLGEGSMCRNAHEVIVLTETMRDYLLQRHGRESFIVPNGAYINSDRGTDKIKPFGLESGKYILSVCRIIRLKGLQYLIPAFKEIKSAEKLVIVGDGDYLPELKKMAESDSRIIFTGNQTDETLDQLYANAKLFVQSSEMEGLSISLLEAMAHGLPCLISEIIANQQAAADTAIYFTSKDVENLKEKLNYCLTNQEKMIEIGRLGKERAENIFNWEKISADTLAIYKK